MARGAGSHRICAAPVSTGIISRKGEATAPARMNYLQERRKPQVLQANFLNVQIADNYHHKLFKSKEKAKWENPSIFPS